MLPLIQLYLRMQAVLSITGSLSRFLCHGAYDLSCPHDSFCPVPQKTRKTIRQSIFRLHSVYGSFRNDIPCDPLFHGFLLAVKLGRLDPRIFRESLIVVAVACLASWQVSLTCKTVCIEGLSLAFIMLPAVIIKIRLYKTKKAALIKTASRNNGAPIRI